MVAKSSQDCSCTGIQGEDSPGPESVPGTIHLSPTPCTLRRHCLLTPHRLNQQQIPWTWAEQQEELLQKFWAAIANYIVIGTPLPSYEMFLITDSSKKGGGGDLWQWQLLDPDHPQDF